MSTDDPALETKVSDSGVVTIPAALRRRLDIEPGDKLRWDTDANGNLAVEVVRQRYGAFEDDDAKADLGSGGVESHDLAGYGDDPVFTEDS